VEELLGGVARRSAPEGTLERILALHAAGSVYGEAVVPRGALLRLPVRDLLRFAAPAAAAAAAAVLFVGFDRAVTSEGAAAPTTMAMVRHAGLPETTASLRVVNDQQLPAYALGYVAGNGP
jgi:hypothetical protein